MPTPDAPGPASRRPEAVTALQRVADRIRTALSDVVEAQGITLQQYHVLRILRDAEPQGLPTLAIAQRMIERAPGITRLLDRLERAELVTRSRGAGDRRQVVCRVTAAGLEKLAALEGRVRAGEEASLRSLTHNEVGAIIHLMERVRHSLEG